MMETKIRITLDTCVLLDILDHGPASPYFGILEWHAAGKIEVTVSNRVFDPDTWKMSEAQQEQLGKLLADHKIDIGAAPFRLDISRLGGGDVLRGPYTKRSPDEVMRFRQIVGMGPSAVPPSKKLRNEIGDYDALDCHFMEARDVFVTLDKRGYFAKAKRQTYERELGLIIQSPEEFIASF